jgi:NAD(P)H-flavin reductase
MRNLLTGYSLSLVGIVYKTWVTPIKNSTLHNTRSGLGGFADRVGALAFALTPLTVALGTRESLLTLLTGIPYQSFNFLHRWTGRIIFVQSALHTISWTVVEARLYQPQPSHYQEFIKQPYMIWGCVAFFLLCFLYVFSLRSVIALTGHEFFRKTHFIVAGVYLGACWAHWAQLKCWMIAALGIMLLDKGLRLLRTLLIHTGRLDPTTGKDPCYHSCCLMSLTQPLGFGFHPAQATVTYFDDAEGGIVRLDFDHKHTPWETGQHFFLCFPSLSIWQSHPFTTASLPEGQANALHHSYIIRCRNGETRRLGALAKTMAEKNSETSSTGSSPAKLPIILSGPYGTPLMPGRTKEGGFSEKTNILAISGGTGVSLTLPVILEAIAGKYSGPSIDFVWIVKEHRDIQWIEPELEQLKNAVMDNEINIRIQIFVTREAEQSATGDALLTSIAQLSERSGSIDDEKGGAEKSVTFYRTSSSTKSLGSCVTVEYLGAQHPDVASIVTNFLEERVAMQFRSRVVGSGPAGMGHDLRKAVAAHNDFKMIWKGEQARHDVELHWDDRMG